MAGEFTTTEDEATFAFLNWFVFVGFGMLFGRILKDAKDRDKLYRIVLYISAPVMVAYIILSCIFGAFFLTKNGWYYAVSPLEAVGLLSIDMVLLSGFYFLLKKVPEQKVSVGIEMSRNLTPIYCAQWCIIGFVDSVFCYLLGYVFPYWAQYVFGVVLIFATYWIAKGWKQLQRKMREKREQKSRSVTA